ncbi:MAG: ubiquitin-conjugating enzyme E2 [Planctomycetes bacterium]|nr:ubiquitin-conjugating enzyme E2 [Planctomycetota bacterium]
MMRESPRTRRLRSDFQAMRQLALESTILEFSYRVVADNEPPEAYLLRFRGVGLARDERSGEVVERNDHEVSVELGASYPRLMPELVWKTPVFHPNISANGVVCLGGYSTHWVPSLRLVELCRMLWDMIRYANFDEESPYNREAAIWIRRWNRHRLPLDDRPLRDLFQGTPPSPAERSECIPDRPIERDGAGTALASNVEAGGARVGVTFADSSGRAGDGEGDVVIVDGGESIRVGAVDTAARRGEWTEEPEIVFLD